MGGTVWNDEGDEHKRACWIQLEYQYEHHFLHSLWICDGRFHCFGNISGVGTKWEHFWQHFFCEVSGQFYTEKIDTNTSPVNFRRPQSWRICLPLLRYWVWCCDGHSPDHPTRQYAFLSKFTSSS